MVYVNGNVYVYLYTIMNNYTYCKLQNQLFPKFSKKLPKNPQTLDMPKREPVRAKMVFGSRVRSEILP